MLKNFTFHTGEVLPELKVHYRVIGNPQGGPVLICTEQEAQDKGCWGQNFAGKLFGPSQALDFTKYCIILSDAIGVGKITKPSDGLRDKVFAYNYDDMVQAQYRLFTEGLGIKHLRLIMGHSMGGMQCCYGS